MPVGIDPQTGQPVMLPYPEDEGAGGMPPELMAMLGGGGAPPGMPSSGPPGGEPSSEPKSDFNGLVSEAMSLLQQAHGAAADEIEAEGVAKLMAGAQSLLARRQKEGQQAMGVSPQQKVMARGMGA